MAAACDGEEAEVGEARGGFWQYLPRGAASVPIGRRLTRGIMDFLFS